MNEHATSFRKALLAAVLLTLLAATAMVAVPVLDAAPGSNCTYYSDSTYTTVVGQFGYDCCNNKVARGVKTQYVKCSTGCFLCVPPPPR